jgi:DNA invertase Pin-like site-specific DNA recombinase
MVAQLDGYIRVSRVGDREGESYISPKVQREKIEGWAKLHDARLGEVVVEEDVSGAKAPEERGLERLLERCERGESDGIIVYRLDRFSRSARDTLDAVARLDAAGARLVGVEDGVDSASPSGELVITVLTGLAREQWKRYRENWATAKREAIKRGVHISTKTPFGYTRRDTNAKTGKPSGPLVPDPKTAPLVAEVYRLRVEESYSYPQLAEFLERKTRRQWYLPSVQNMLRNEVYLGVAWNGDYRMEGAHPALVDRSLFDAVKAARTASLPGEPAGRGHAAPLQPPRRRPSPLARAQAGVGTEPAGARQPRLLRSIDHQRRGTRRRRVPAVGGTDRAGARRRARRAQAS